jgi:hypothetical protein
MGLAGFNRARARQAAEHKQRVEKQKAVVKPIPKTVITEKPKGTSKGKSNKKGK